MGSVGDAIIVELPSTDAPRAPSAPAGGASSFSDHAHGSSSWRAPLQTKAVPLVSAFFAGREDSVIAERLTSSSATTKLCDQRHDRHGAVGGWRAGVPALNPEFSISARLGERLMEAKCLWRGSAGLQ